jgi:ABC-type transporter Mla MlaB component
MAMADSLIITETNDRVVTLHLQGQLTAHTVEIFNEYARRAMESGARFLLVDLSGVSIITSAGLLALHNCFMHFTPHVEIEAWQHQHPHDLFKSPYFKLAGASPDVYYILSLAGFIQNIPIYPNVQDALDSFEA